MSNLKLYVIIFTAVPLTFRDMNWVHPPMPRRETTCMDEGNADIAGANICHPWWLNTRIHAGDGR